MDYPKRKPIRLKRYDYSQNGAYFITICAYHMVPYFGDVGNITPAKQMIMKTFREIINSFDHVYCPKFVVMPNHLHAMIVIKRTDTEYAPAISTVIQSFKRLSTIRYCKLVHSGYAKPFDGALWQRSYYDRVIRNDFEYAEVLRYIEENPRKWLLNRCEPDLIF